MDVADPHEAPQQLATPSEPRRQFPYTIPPKIEHYATMRYHM